MFPRTIRNFNAFVDGTSYFGRVRTGTLPNLQLEIVERREDGRDAPYHVDMGMQAMNASMEFIEWPAPVFRLLGNRTPLVLRPVGRDERDYADVDAFVFTIRGIWKGLEAGQLQAGSETLLTATCGVDYFRVERNGEELVEIDVENAVRRIGGTDQMAEMRRAMGI